MINRDNYRRVIEYLRFRLDVLQRDRLSINRDRLWLNHLLRWADDVPFSDVPKIRPVYPQYLLKLRNRANGKPLTASGLKRGCQAARVFFDWLRTRGREYAAISPDWIVTLQAPKLPAQPPKQREAVSLDMVRHLLAVEGDDLLTRRDRAAAAFLFLSGMRSSAFCSLPLECVNVPERTVMQFPTLGVRTKNRKAAITYLLDVPDLLAVVQAWDDFIRSQLPPSAMWYTVLSGFDGRLTDTPAGRYRNIHLSRNIKALFERAGLPPMTPHKFRHGHAVYGLKHAQEMSDYKAVSMNLMHSSLGVTDSVYAILNSEDMAARIAGLGKGDARRPNVELVKALQDLLAQWDSG